MVDLDAYFARVGYAGPRTAGLETLRALHRLHPAAIPFETIDVRLGLGVSLDPEAVDAKMITGGRGGYCFEHNSLFMRVLTALGFRVEALIARSLWGRAPAEIGARTHMALRVRCDGSDWLADVGFGGCMLTTPLRMDLRDAQGTAFEPRRLTPVAGELRLEALIGETWAPVCDLVLAPQRPADLEAANWFVSTHPGSAFHGTLVVTRTAERTRWLLTDNRLTIRRTGEDTERRDLDADELERSLAEDFKLAVQPQWRGLLEAVAGRPPPEGLAHRA
jgi:N-hydroxyarylamine O-acetyltransferase